MLNFFGKNRSSRRAHAAPTSRTVAQQSRRRRFCGMEQLEDRSLLAIDLVSITGANVQGNLDSYQAVSSADGRYIAFTSQATNWTTDTNGKEDIYLKDSQTGLISLLSTATNGTQGNDQSYNASISANGRYVVFESAATNLVNGDTNNSREVFLKDTQTGVLTRIATDVNGVQGDGQSSEPEISADGRYVTFYSTATNLVTGDTNGTADIFIKDTQTGVVTLVSTAVNGTQGNGASFSPTISANGRYVAFMSLASNFVSGDTNNEYDIFLKDLQTGIVTRLNTASNGTQGDDQSSAPAISADGRFVVFESEATNLVSGDTNNAKDIFLRDTLTGTLTRVSADANGVQGNNESEQTSISADGRFVVFRSGATNLVSGDTNGQFDIFIKDTQTGAVTRLSTASNLTEANSPSYRPSISGDGRFVAFESYANNLVVADANILADVYRVTTPVTTPTVTSPTAANLTSTTVVLGGNVASDNGAAITARGVIYALTSVNNNPTLGGNGVTVVTDAATTTGIFTENISGLTPGQSYSFVAYATNSQGTTYTSVTTFASTASFWNNSAVPSSVINNSSSVELGVQFRSTIGGYISGIRVFRTSNEIVSQQVTLWSSTGTVLATATANLSGSGWKEVHFATPVQIQANQTYTASYFSTLGRYGYNWNYFNTAFTNGPLTALNGVYRYNIMSAFPTQTYLNTNYWVDVTFNNAAVTAPTVIATSPSDAATNVAVNSSVTVQFNTPMKASTITATNLVLKDSTNATVPAIVSYDTTTNTATVTPNALLTTASTYTLTVVSGASGVAASDGTLMASDYITSFKTVSVAASSLWTDSTIPSSSVTTDRPVELGVQFKSTVAGFINGIRLYKPTSETVNQSVTLWSSTGVALATATATLSGSGWKEVFFNAAVAIVANQTYTASYFASLGRYAYNWFYFNSPYTNGSLTAQKGVYRYNSTSAFPTLSSQNTNYWADVIMT